MQGRESHCNRVISVQEAIVQTFCVMGREGEIWITRATNLTRWKVHGFNNYCGHCFAFCMFDDFREGRIASHLQKCPMTMPTKFHAPTCARVQSEAKEGKQNDAKVELILCFFIPINFLLHNCGRQQCWMWNNPIGAGKCPFSKMMFSKCKIVLCLIAKNCVCSEISVRACLCLRIQSWFTEIQEMNQECCQNESNIWCNQKRKQKLLASLTIVWFWTMWKANFCLDRFFWAERKAISDCIVAIQIKLYDATL